MNPVSEANCPPCGLQTSWLMLTKYCTCDLWFWTCSFSSIPMRVSKLKHILPLCHRILEECGSNDSKSYVSLIEKCSMVEDCNLFMIVCLGGEESSIINWNPGWVDHKDPSDVLFAWFHWRVILDWHLDMTIWGTIWTWPSFLNVIIMACKNRSSNGSAFMKVIIDKRCMGDGICASILERIAVKKPRAGILQHLKLGFSWNCVVLVSPEWTCQKRRIRPHEPWKKPWLFRL